jgi:signal transduction histidine kinase
MLQSQPEITFVLIAGTSIMLLVVVFVFIFMLLYERKRINYQKRLFDMETENQKRVLEVTIAVQENERQQFAAELHDGLGQMLTSLLMNLNATETIHKDNSNSPTQVTENLLIMQQLTKQSIEEVRAISRKLMPVVLNDFGLLEAIDDLCHKTGKTTHLIIDFNKPNFSFRLPKEMERAFYRITQELLNNTLKYAHASKVNIELKHTDNNLLYTYSDNGVGMKMHDEKGKGLGLLNIEGRLSVMNGKILPEEVVMPDGFQIRISVPFSFSSLS